MSTDSPGAHRVRASDAEREQLAQVLRAAMTEGRLSLEEGEERLAKAYAAKYRDELGPLTADLPGGGWQALADAPEAVAEDRRHVRRHASVLAIAAGVLIGLWVLSGAHFFWPAIPLLFLFFAWRRHSWYRRWARSAPPPWAAGGWGPPWARGRYRHWHSR
jgi:hypothetical protein